MKHLHSLDNEPLYYQITDWGIEIQKPEDITDDLIKQHIANISSEEVRNFQITLAQDYGVQEFVKAWNKYIGIKGTFNRNTESDLCFAVIDPTTIKIQNV